MRHIKKLKCLQISGCTLFLLIFPLIILAVVLAFIASIFEANIIQMGSPGKITEITFLIASVFGLCAAVFYSSGINHEETEWRFITEGQCEKVKICLRCGKELERQIIHEFGSWESMNDGLFVQVRTCKRCHVAEETLNKPHYDASIIDAYLDIEEKKQTEEVTLSMFTSLTSYDLFINSPISYWVDKPGYTLSDGPKQVSGYAVGYKAPQETKHMASKRNDLYEDYKDRIFGHGTDYFDGLIQYIPCKYRENEQILKLFLIVTSIKPMKQKTSEQHKVIHQQAEYQEWVSDGSYGGPAGSVHYELVQPEISHITTRYELIADYRQNIQAIRRFLECPESVRQKVARTLPPDLKDIVEQHLT